MADIKLKDVKKLEEWNAKEFRKLRITINNRISALQSSSSPKELPIKHPLRGLLEGDCKELLLKVQKAEKTLAQS